MKITRVNVYYQVGVFYKKYRSLNLGYNLEAEIEDNEDPVKIVAMIREKLRNKLAKDAKIEVEAWRKLGAQVEAMAETPNFD